MKGFTNVDKHVIRAAIINWKYRYDQGKVIRDKGINLFYTHNYICGSRLTKWWNRKESKHSFALKQIPSFGSWSDILSRYLDENEIELLYNWEWGSGRQQCEAARSLVDASTFDTILMDHELCKWVNEHK